MIALILASAYLFLVACGSATARASIAERRALRQHITREIVETHYRQSVMGVRVTPTRYEYKHRLGGGLHYIARRWNLIAAATRARYANPPHKRGWLCIHRFEGSWQDAGDPYWGGLQMDRSFMGTYAPRLLLRRGFANRWSPLEQMWVAERAHRSGRGYGPWPKTASYCGLL